MADLGLGISQGGLRERHQMVTEIAKAFVFVGLIVAIGFIRVELTRGSAQAEETNSYTASRINAAFEVVSEIPPVEPVGIPMAAKGDLLIPFDCVRLPNTARAECANLAYKALTEPSFVVATSFGSTTTLLRRDAMAVAEVFDEVFWQQGSVVSE